MSCVTVTVVITFPINCMVVCSNLTHQLIKRLWLTLKGYTMNLT